MPRSGSKNPRISTARVPAHESLLQTDLSRWAGERISRGGRQDALLGRVEELRLSLDGTEVEARVRGNRTLPYRVKVVVADSDPVARCTCSREVPGPCRHAVAALETLRFPIPEAAPPGTRWRGRPPGRVGAGRGRIIQPARSVPGYVILGGAERIRTRDERIGLARNEERLTRRQRARRDRAQLKLLSAKAGPPRYEVVSTRTSRPEIVTLRGRDVERFSCTCSDFETNELGTCRHVEKVRNWRGRQKRADRRSVPERLMSVWVCPREWIDRVPALLSEVRLESPGELPDTLAGYFDGEGWLRAPPEDCPEPSWVERAVEAARRLCDERRWVWDLDSAVEARIQAAQAEDRLAACRNVASRDEEVWRGVIDGITFKLHAYQEHGARFLARTGRAFLADDMGLGKTLEAIVATLLLRRSANARKALVVCPASLKHQWNAEIRKACGERGVVVEGQRSARLRLYEQWTDGFLILNYELVLRDMDAIRATKPDLIILDEAQRIKNWNTKTARAVKRLESPHAFILTGTPLENRLIELHSLVEFLYARAAGPRWRLLPFHAVTEPGGRVVAYEGLDVLRGRLKGFFLRRERKNVQDQLPERTDNTFWTGMTSAQRRPYRKHASAAASLLSRKQPLRPQEIRSLLRALTSMRILCNSYAQYAWDSYEPLVRGKTSTPEPDVRALSSPKLEEFSRALEDLLDESDSKVVVFSQWERMLRLAHFAVQGVLESRDLTAEVFHGGLTARARGEMLDSFRRDPEFRVLFSTDAGGLGLNLQEAASIVVNLEVPWNPAVLEQRIGRVHRIGQRRSVQVLHFVTRGAIEERVRLVVESKRALFEGLLVDRADEVILDDSAHASFLERARTLIEDANVPES